ncbi:von Willebrand factor A domain-containing protein 5A [Tritrichomonas musculus]|uniref:von Willebrand factor A domain-containing protein 5A n=1 Tax=Tritrichomonas musculus TaxID=1915356 RepID=A0ABR2H401_9EUKA
MTYGTCCILNNDNQRCMEIESVQINGFQRGLLVNFEIIQSFIHHEKEAKEVSYMFPNDLKICIYDTTFIIGDEIIKPQIKSKIEAQKTYEEAVETGHTAIFGSNINDSLTLFKLGNVQPNISCKVILKIAFSGQLTTEKTFYIKFPIDVYTPSGSKNCLDSISSNFSFKLQCDIEKVSKLTSNVRNYNFDDTTKMFSIEDRIENNDNEKSIIITIETKEQIKSSAFLTQTNQVNFDGCAITITPNLPKTDEVNSEFIFVVDCSGSMYGSSIQKASECLEFFIKSLVPNSFFNVVRFGSHYEKLFKESVAYNDKTAEKAVKFAQKLEADLGGTDIFNPLNDIFKEANKHGQRQIFVMTDGEVFNAGQVLNLVSCNSKNNRCFSIGIGRGCDAGLVEGIAEESNGKSDFVQEGDSISDKVIPQLQSSFQTEVTSVEIHVENDDKFEVSPFPIRPINPSGSSVIYLRRKRDSKDDENAFNKGILVTGTYGKQSIEIPIEDISSLPEVEEDQSGCSGGQNIGKCILPLFAFNQLRRYERMADLSNEDISKAVELSISSGVLCKYTGFVGISETHNPGRFDNAINHLNQAIAAGQDSMLALLDQDRQRITSANSSFSAVNSDACKVGFKKSRPIRGFFRTIYDAIFGSKNDPEPAPPPCNETYKEELEPYSSSPVNDNDNNNNNNNDDNMLILLTRFQKADGYWENLEKVQSLAGIKIDHIDEIKINDKDIEIKCIATIIAVATLRVKYENKKNSWVLIEAKALTWLKKILGDQIDIEKVISKIESLL